MSNTQKRTAGLVFLAGLLALQPAVMSAPAVFPTGVTIHEEGVAEGHVLLGGQDGNVYLIDAAGNAVHSWTTLPCGWSGAIKPLPGGNILTKSCTSVVELTWWGTVAWEYLPPTGVTLHHDSERLPNGNTLLLGRRQILDPAISDLTIREDLLLEVNPAGQVVWDWYEADHFDEFGFSQERLDLIYDRGGDWSHCNAAAPIPENTSHTDPRFAPGNIIVSVRHQNTIAVIDRMTGEIVWVQTDGTVGQHDTHMISDDRPGGGNILAFDNGWAVDRSVIPNRYYSRIVEIDPLTGNLAYVYTADASGLHIGSFFSSAKSGVQRLVNGNTLIAETKSGRVFEVTPAGQIVWEYVSPYFNAGGASNEVYRAYKVPLDWAAPLFAPDLAVSAQETPDPVQAGDSLEYTVQLANVGDDPAIHVELTAQVPEGTTFVSVGAPEGWSCSTPGVGAAGSISCSNSSLGAGAVAIFEIAVNVDLCAGGDTSVTQVAGASSSGGETFTSNNSTTTETTVICP